MSRLIEQFNKDTDFVKAVQDYRDRKNISVFGVQPLAKQIICAQEKKAIVLCADVSSARDYVNGINALDTRAVFLPPKEDELTFSSVKSGENIKERLTCFYKILKNEVDVVVITPSSFLNLYPNREDFAEHVIRVEKNGDIAPLDIVKKLVESGYVRQSQITDVGEFSLRGDILDIFPINSSVAVRIEFFGDTIERLREFSPDTQLSGKEIESIEISPFAEIFEFDDDLCKKIEDGFYKKLTPDSKTRADEIAQNIISSIEGGEIRYYQNWLLPICKHSNIFEFFAFDRLVIDDNKQCYDVVQYAIKEHEARFESLYKNGEVCDFCKGQMLAIEDVINTDNVSFLSFGSIMNANRFFSPIAVYKAGCSPIASYLHDYRPLYDDVEKWLSRGWRIRFLVEGNTSVIIRDFLTERGVRLGQNVTIEPSSVEKGCAFDNDKVVFVCNGDLSARAKRKSISRSKRNAFTAPQIGDFVVHDKHGIGKCEGTTKLHVMGAEREYVVVLYAGGDKLYVPIENIDTLSKYVADGREPKLSKMGGAEFKKLKEKVKQSVKKLAVDLMELYSERLKNDGHKYSEDDGLLHEFEDKFPHAETEDQLVAVEECLKDLKSGKIMDRLLCGDVGYGKTEVALRVAFKVICEGKQVAMLAPTTILAKQHYETVKKRMDEFGVNSARLTRLDSAKSIKETEAKIKEGKVDIVVGTHKMLAKTVDFKNLGLLILDEEQRFGVSDKEKIKDAKRNVNVLTLSATPIPRTLHMSMVGIRDISVLDEPPVSRIPVQTFVVNYGDELLKDAISREVSRKGQVFVVYNRVASIDEFAYRLSEMMPSVRFCVAHGQMDEKTLENRIDAFVDGKYDVLVASTIIENGIDMPNANTLFVVEADKMGLSQLYQLKGRVGRSNRMAYAYFTYDERKMMGENAHKRLEALASYTEFGSGFKIAMRDMEIRGAGNIMGAEQHGHMEKVGYDTYCALLKEAVAELEGREIDKKREVRMSVDYDTFIPDTYVEDTEWRLRLYSKIAEVSSVKMREKLLEEIRDVYGNIPDSVKNLVDVALMKNLACLIKASAVVVKRNERKIIFDKICDLSNKVNEIATSYFATLVIDEKPYLKFRNNNDMMKFLLNCHKILKLPQAN